MKLTFRLKGGPGSGHRDHKGIPGHRGGSLPDGATPKSEGQINFDKYTVWDVIPDAGSYISDVESTTGKPVGWREIVDILSDFGKIPSEIPESMYEKFLEYVARQYTGDLPNSEKPKTSTVKKPTTPAITPKTNKEDYSLSHKVEHGVYVPTKPIKVWKFAGSKARNYHYGSAQLFQPIYQEDVVTKSDKLLHWPGGLFMERNGERTKIQFEEPDDFSPFEHSYGGDMSLFPTKATKFMGR